VLAARRDEHGGNGGRSHQPVQPQRPTPPYAESPRYVR
jgi:hypothetical protein